MIIGMAWPVWLAWILALFFAANGMVNIIGPKSMRDGFARWGYPSWFHLLNGALQLAIAVLLLMGATRLLGLGLGILLCLVIFVTLVRLQRCFAGADLATLLLARGITAKMAGTVRSRASRSSPSAGRTSRPLVACNVIVACASTMRLAFNLKTHNFACFGVHDRHALRANAVPIAVPR